MELQQEFEKWFEAFKKTAQEDFGYSESETSSFNTKNWKQYYDLGLTPFEAMIEHLKKSFKNQI